MFNGNANLLFKSTASYFTRRCLACLNRRLKSAIFTRMFFILSKILAFIITPLTWVAGLLLYSWFTKNEKRKRKCFAAALIVLLFFSNSFILEEFMRAWEISAKPYSELKEPYDAAIVLGGVLMYDENMDRLQFVRSSDRLMQAIELYKKGYAKKIVFIGGSGSIAHAEVREAPLAQRFLLTAGIPQEDILIETESRNTHENAVNAKELLDKNVPGSKFLLITSGFHMRRSMGCFKKAGMAPDPYSTDRYSGPRHYDLDHLFIPNTEALGGWNVLLHEWVGYISYKISGYI
jgi:uncharacterized SAM-binding protein YcdF (DUF218 family)